MHEPNSRNLGFTLIEITVVMIMLGVLSVGALSGGAGWVQEWQITGTRQDLLSEASTALNRMVREIRTVRNRQSIMGYWVGNVWYPYLSSTRFPFYNSSSPSNSIDFRYDSGTNTLYRNFNSTGEQPLATNVTAFSFTYFRSDLQQTTPYVTVVYTDIRLVKIQMSLTKGGQTVTLRTAVAPVNLQMK